MVKNKIQFFNIPLNPSHDHHLTRELTGFATDFQKVYSVLQTTSLRTTLLSTKIALHIVSISSKTSGKKIKAMTRAQQTVSIGLLFASVCANRLRKIYAKQYKLTAETALSCTIPATHPTSEHNFRRDNTSCRLCYFNLDCP